MVFADLPYGCTNNRWDCPISLPDLWEQLLRVGTLACPFVFTSMQPFTSKLVMSMPKLFKYELIWQKENATGFLNAKKQPMRCHESILVFYRKQPVYNPQMRDGKPYTVRRSGRGSSNYRKLYTCETICDDGKRYPLSVLPIARDNHSRVHPTQKPVALLEWLIKTYTHPGDAVLDPCMGVGTTGLACLNTDRLCVGIERDPIYFTIASQRLDTARSLLDASRTLPTFSL